MWESFLFFPFIFFSFFQSRSKKILKNPINNIQIVPNFIWINCVNAHGYWMPTLSCHYFFHASAGWVVVFGRMDGAGHQLQETKSKNN